eukprot:363740-Chlamydomonas_euryale.AAC.13
MLDHTPTSSRTARLWWELPTADRSVPGSPSTTTSRSAPGSERPQACQRKQAQTGKCKCGADSGDNNAGNAWHDPGNQAVSSLPFETATPQFCRKQCTS